MTDIYIHIGTHKTGSSTIQHALRDASQANGVNWIYSGTTRTIKDLMRAKQYDNALVKRLKLEIERKMLHAKSVKAKRVIISSEALSGLPDTGYQNSNAVFSMLHEATSQYNTKIVVFLRRQDSFVQSMYTQLIHQGVSLDFESFLKQFSSPNALDYSRMLDELSVAFGEQNLIVKSYHESSTLGLIDNFSEIVESNLPIPSKKGDRNVSYSIHAVEIAKICNKYLNQKEKKQLRHSLQAVLAKKRTEPFTYFTDEERIKFLNKYQLSNQDVANRFFEGNLERLFPTQKKTKLSSNHDNLTYDDVARVVVHILKINSKNNESGIIAGIRVALKGYPRFSRFLQKVRHRF